MDRLISHITDYSKIIILSDTLSENNSRLIFDIINKKLEKELSIFNGFYCLEGYDKYRVMDFYENVDKTNIINIIKNHKYLIRFKMVDGTFTNITKTISYNVFYYSDLVLSLVNGTCIIVKNKMSDEKRIRCNLDNYIRISKLAKIIDNIDGHNS
jgi:hypothetical protein